MLKKDIYLGVVKNFNFNGVIGDICCPLLKINDSEFINLIMVSNTINFLTNSKRLLVTSKDGFILKEGHNLSDNYSAYVDEYSIMNYYTNFTINEDVSIFKFYKDYFAYCNLDEKGHSLSKKLR